jgi:hypothetical protein
MKQMLNICRQTAEERMQLFGKLSAKWMENYKANTIIPQYQSLNQDDYDESEYWYKPWSRILEKDLKDRYIYRIRARNSSIGVYNQKYRSFTLPRYKIDSWFLFDEYDFATGPPYGTAVPYEEIQRMSDTFYVHKKSKLNYLKKFLTSPILITK